MILSRLQQQQQHRLILRNLQQSLQKTTRWKSKSFNTGIRRLGYTNRNVSLLLSSSSSSSPRRETNELVVNRIDRTLSYKAGNSYDDDDENDGDMMSTKNATESVVQDMVSHIRTSTDATTGSTSSTSGMQVQPDTVVLQIKSAVTRSLQIIETTATATAKVSSSNNEPTNHHDRQQHPDYSTNPTITTTALAHSLWSYVLRPQQQQQQSNTIAIDATAGNGYDSVAIAKLLFPQFIISNDSIKFFDTDSNDIEGDDDNNGDDDLVSAREPDLQDTDGKSAGSTTQTQSMLYAMDIQWTACRNTTQQLSSILPTHILSNNVQICHTSHETLPIVTDVALIVYNLGFLPGTNSKMITDKSITTKTMTTIASMGQAVQLLRVGGMLSVTTYPRTNIMEDTAVQLFMETLALFSSQTQSWSDYIQDVPILQPSTAELDDSNNKEECLNVRELLLQTLHEVHSNRPTQKWRVTQHKKFGRLHAPILLTAVRIQ